MRKLIALLFCCVLALAGPLAGTASAGGGGVGASAHHCAPQTAGGEAPPGAVSKQLWMLGGAITDAGVAQVGNAVQKNACTVYAQLGV